MVQNLDKWKRRLAAIPEAVKDAAQAQLEANAGQMVGLLKQAAPSGNDIAPGRRGTADAARESQAQDALRDSIRWEESPTRELKVVVICDVKDERGHPYAQHVEYGHRTPDGKHVPAHPFWWPTYRAYKKRLRRQMLAATRKAVKARWDQG